MAASRRAARPVRARCTPRHDRIGTIVKIRASILAALLPVLLLAALLAWEFQWRARHDLLKPQASAPDAGHVAEVRVLPQARGCAAGVYLRGPYGWLRSLSPQLVFAGDCEEVDARWFGPHRLVIACQLRSGEPQLLHDVVDGVAIEVIVERQFAQAGGPDTTCPAPARRREPATTASGSAPCGT